jgi:hypothetical protein
MKSLNIETKDFNSILGKDTDVKTGVLIGAVVEAKANVYVLANTPTIPTEADHLLAKLNYKLDEASTYSDWILEHTRQISRLLPGGLAILGLYTFANEDSLLDPKGSSECLRCVQNILHAINGEVVRGDWLLHLHVTPKPKSVVRVLDLKTDRFTVIELKQGPLMKLEEIRCRMNIVLDSGRQEGTLQNAIQKLLNHWSSQLSYTKYMIDGLTDSEAQLAALKPVLIT